MIAIADLVEVGLPAPDSPVSDEIRRPTLESAGLIAANNTEQWNQVRAFGQQVEPEQRAGLRGVLRRQHQITIDRGLEQRPHVVGAADSGQTDDWSVTLDGLV